MILQITIGYCRTALGVVPRVWCTLEVAPRDQWQSPDHGGGLLDAEQSLGLYSLNISFRHSGGCGCVRDTFDIVSRDVFAVTADDQVYRHATLIGVKVNPDWMWLPPIDISADDMVSLNQELYRPEGGPPIGLANASCRR